MELQKITKTWKSRHRHTSEKAEVKEIEEIAEIEEIQVEFPPQEKEKQDIEDSFKSDSVSRPLIQSLEEEHIETPTMGNESEKTPTDLGRKKVDFNDGDEDGFGDSSSQGSTERRNKSVPNDKNTSKAGSSSNQSISQGIDHKGGHKNKFK